MKSQQRINLQPAYLLHRHAFRDASVIAEFVTRDFGRLALIVRGHGKGSRRCLDVFSPLLVSFSRRRELGTLHTLEPAGPAPKLVQEAVFCGYYANELLIRMTHRDEPVPELFAAYQALLETLAAGEDDLRGLRLFEKRLLEILGYGRDLTREWQSGRPLDPAGNYRVVPEQGPEPVAAGVRDGNVFVGSSLLSLAREELADQTALRDARRLLRMSLDYYLDGRPLKSREVMRALRRHRRPMPAESGA